MSHGYRCEYSEALLTDGDRKHNVFFIIIFLVNFLGIFGSLRKAAAQLQG